ncbi:MAG: hypothetical protein WEC34_04220 [Acidimicrobiia bacterium]
MRRRNFGRLMLAVIMAGALTIGVTSGLALPGGLAGTNMQASGFAPCTWNSPGPPPVSSCPVAQRTAVVEATCDPAGESTLAITRSGFVFGAYNGTYEETLTATLGPQTGPPAPAFQPFAWSGVQAGTVGFKTGLIRSLVASFTITAYDGTVIAGEKTLADDLANTGVCVKVDGDVPPSAVFTQPAYGYFYLLNAQVLRYTATITPPGGPALPVSGDAEAYLGNSFGLCCDGATSITDTVGTVISSQGHLAQGFGTIHSAVGTTTATATPTGVDVEVSPAPGLQLMFDNVTAEGETSVTALQSIPPLPAGFQVGDPPMFYEISTTASFSGGVRVCAPYGSVPAGTTPRLLHYADAAWVDITTDFDPDTRIVCGSTTSLSPFAAVFAASEPAYKDECENGGWKTFAAPAFKNQGDCVSFVQAKPKQP